MAYAIDILRREHANMAKLLSLLEQQIGKVEQSQSPDYELIKSIADYFADFPATCHHPKEDVLFSRWLGRDETADAVVEELSFEHRSIANSGV